MYKEDEALNNLQGLICHKTRPNHTHTNTHTYTHTLTYLVIVSSSAVLKMQIKR